MKQTAITAIRWAVAAFLALCAIAFLPHFVSALFGVGAILAAPIERIQDEFARIAKTDKSPLPLVAVLFVGGIALSPKTTAEQVPLGATAQSIQPIARAAHLVAEEEKELDARIAFAECYLDPKTEVLEYSNKDTDPLELVECSVSEVDISTDDSLDLKSVGRQSVEYKLSLGDEPKTQTVDFIIRDTHSPVIALAHDTIEIDQGSSFDPASFVESVKDEVDGDLPFADSPPSARDGESGTSQIYDAGWYEITGEFDVNAPSKYFFTIHASDKHGNETSKEATLVVNEVTPIVAAPAEAEAPAADAHETTYILNVNTGKFHYPTCRSVKQMNESNKREITSTHDEMVAKGYSPCQNCNP